MLTYSDFPPNKKAFIFELDNVLFPEKDYLLQVYYLFANFLEYAETFPPAADVIQFMKTAYESRGSAGIFEKVQHAFGINAAYSANFIRLHKTAKLPLKLLLFKNMLKLMQEMVIDRKQIFIVTNGDPAVQLNKITHVEWKGLEKYLTLYFADEIKPKPETDVFTYILEKHLLDRKDFVVFGNSSIDEEFAANSGVDYVNVGEIN